MWASCYVYISIPFPLKPGLSHPAVQPPQPPTSPPPTLCGISEQVRSCNLTCAVLAGFDFAVGLLLHRLLVLSHLLQTQPCGKSKDTDTHTIRTARDKCFNFTGCVLGVKS